LLGELWMVYGTLTGILGFSSLAMSYLGPAEPFYKLSE
jgi:hypothetical protein